MKISFELVPRDILSIKEQISFIKTLNYIDTINVPDILRFEHRSWELNNFINKKIYNFIPHIRIMDFDLNKNKLFNIIEDNQLKEILLITGDIPQNMSHKIYDNDIFKTISIIKNKFPNIKIYAGFDPYRSNIKDEIKRMNRKIEHGADFLMSQPFFDKRLMEIYSDEFPKEKIFLGISPVISENSKKYWENVNNVVFPKNFQINYEWNIEFANEVIEFSKKNNSNIYFMPIGINLKKYFKDIII